MKWSMLLLWIATLAVTAAEERVIPVPNDPYAKHVLVHKSGKPNHRVVVTKRTGLTGELYTKRAYNCEKQTVRMLSSGNTLDILDGHENDWPEKPVASRSVSEDIGMQACSDS